MYLAVVVSRYLSLAVNLGYELQSLNSFHDNTEAFTDKSSSFNFKKVSLVLIELIALILVVNNTSHS